VKELKELLEANAEDLPPIYCDMDMVLCNFMKAADNVVGGSFVTADKEERWNRINQTKGFWENLEWMPGAKNLYRKISKYNTYILSAFSGKDPASKSGKMKWLAKNTDFKRSKIHLVMRSQKQKFATTDGKPNVLIDDYIKNIKEWESKGGIGVHHTNVSKSIGELNRLGFK
jgi:5'(3')-deoxyribonucleotidase